MIGDVTCRCEACGETSRVPPLEDWRGLDAILCRFCGADLRAQVLGRVRRLIDRVDRVASEPEPEG